MKNKFIKISLLCIAIILMAITFYQIAKYEVISVSVKEGNVKALNSNGKGTIVAGQNPDTYSYKTGIGSEWIIGENTKWGLTVETSYVPQYYVNENNKRQIFCIEPGVGIPQPASSKNVLKVLIEAYKKQLSASESPWQRKTPNHALHALAFSTWVNGDGEDMGGVDIVGILGSELVRKLPKKYMYSPLYLNLPEVYKSDGGERDLPVAAAYIVSDEPIGEWSQRKQSALWHLGEGLIVGTGESVHDDTSSEQKAYEAEVKAYKSYDGKVRENGLTPKNETDIKNVAVKLEKAAKEYTVGPFKISYTSGIYNNSVAFSGISEIIAQGYNKNNQLVKENIKIEKIILKDTATGAYGNAQTPEYFNPSSDLKVDRSTQVYPNSGQDFKIVFKLSETESKDIASISIKVKFKYMLANGKYQKLKGTQTSYQLAHTHIKIGNAWWCRIGESNNRTDSKSQILMSADAIRTVYEQELEIAKNLPLVTTVNLGGYVWEDVPSGKENLADGQKGEKDRPIQNVKVTLHTSDGSPVTLADLNEPGITSEQIMHRVNPTYTDANGRYMFEGADAGKTYYVTFEYNGQTYLPTNYNTSNTSLWQVTSKGTEKVVDRTNYNNKFKEIGSSPLNYVSSNSLNSGKLVSKDGKYYNETYSQFELMGFVLDTNGNYQPIGTALVDGFYKLQNGNIVETDTIQEGVISLKIKEYINANKKSPDANAMKAIYTKIVNEEGNGFFQQKLMEYILKNKKVPEIGSDAWKEINKEKEEEEAKLWRKLQFIEDSKITSYTQAQGASKYDLYPRSGEDELYINQGLWRRQQADLSLRKDIVYAAAKINGKTQIYEYNNRGNSGYWEIQLRMRNYDNYYASTYTREIYPADYSYRKTAEHPGAELDLYVTYQITVKNNSTSILNEIEEIVDYYDKDYTYMNNLSWVMYKKNNSDGNSAITLKEEDYFSTMDKLELQGDLKTNAKPISSSYSTTQNGNGTYTGTSKYGSSSQQDLEKSYNSIYIKGLNGKKLASGEEAYVYLTFKVNKDSNGIITDDDNSLKQNYAEINGYTTYYKDGTKLPNNQTMGSTNVAGLIDVNSKPGNLKLSDTQGEKPERNFEDDTDRAKSIKVTVSNQFARSINGTVWEDERVHNVASAMIGDGVRQDGELGIKGVTVELIEKLADGKEYTLARTTTGDNGRYEFKVNEEGKFYIIPGDYIIRFYYGDTDATVLTSKDGGSNLTSYNGQDFKCTVYQKDMTTAETLNQKDGKYDLAAADALGKNVSDAKDILGTNTTKGTRQYVDHYSSNKENGVTNHLAEVLASPYANPVNKDLVKELRENTQMTAETDLIVFEIEYNRTKSAGQRPSDSDTNNNSINGNYTLRNLDFGLTERPKAQLELNQKVTNVKVTLANGNVLFDTTKGTTNLSWAPGTPYELNKNMTDNKYNQYYGTDHRYAYRTKINELLNNIYKNGGNGLINVTMDEELMHGATIKISYEMFIANVGETDYTGQDFYYNGTGAAADRQVTTKANTVLNYVSNNLQYREDDNNGKGWEIVKDVVSTEGINEKLKDSVARNNVILKTKGLNKVLRPGEKTDTVSLVLTQLITSQNTSDDRTYTNIAEITSITNMAARRMAYSVQGNQDPTANPTEVDSAQAEKVVILPPFGIGEIILYVTVAIAGLAILIVGIIFIKKKVLKK